MKNTLCFSKPVLEESVEHVSSFSKNSEHKEETTRSLALRRQNQEVT